MTENEKSDEDGVLYGGNEAEDMSSEEVREKAIEALEEADGAWVLTGNLIDEDGDGEFEAVGGESIRFGRDDLTDEERGAIGETFRESVLEVALPEGAELRRLDAGLLGALMGGVNVPGYGDDDDEETDDDPSRMFQ